MEASHTDCIIPTVKFGGGSVIIWRSMSTAGIGELFMLVGRMNSKRYIDMLEGKLIENNEPEVHFSTRQSCYKSRAISQWFTDNNVFE